MSVAGESSRYKLPLPEADVFDMNVPPPQRIEQQTPDLGLLKPRRPGSGRRVLQILLGLARRPLRLAGGVCIGLQLLNRFIQAERRRPCHLCPKVGERNAKIMRNMNSSNKLAEGFEAAGIGLQDSEGIRPRATRETQETLKLRAQVGVVVQDLARI